MARRSLVSVLLLLVALSLGSAGWFGPVAQSGVGSIEWTEEQQMPTARSEMPAVVLDGVIYVFGGLDSSGRTLRAAEAFDTESGAWEVLEPLPVPLHHTGAAVSSGRIYVTGGYTDLEFRTDNPGSWVYTPSTGSWSRVADMPAPRAAHALVALDDRIYVVGGVGPGSSELWAFDPDTGDWVTALAPIPTPREHLTAVAVGGLIYAIGGRLGGSNLSTVESYDPTTDSWSSLPEMPTPRSGLSAAVVAGRIHVGGGEDLLGERTFAVHEIFDPVAGEWRAGPPLPSPRHGLASAGVDGTWYVIGGATRPGAQTFGSLTDEVAALAVGAGEG